MAILSPNPFPSSAVARYSDTASDVGFTTVATDAVRRGMTLLEQYARAGSVNGGDSSGGVVAIVGEYGTGKTHLALDLLFQASRHQPPIQSFYLDAPGDSFLRLYLERFLPRLGRRALRARVGEYYSDIVAEELEDSPLTRPVAADLRARSVDPVLVVRRLGLMESAFQERLIERLSAVTEDPSFGTALALFLRPEFEATVWEWLSGQPPDAVLAERDIGARIDSDAKALQAIGVVALLLGGQRRRFVLVFDEMEKVIVPVSGPGDEGTLSAFKRLFEIISKTGALLILCGLPEFLEALPDDARQRISVVIRPTRLTSDDAIRFIEDVQERSSGVRELKPFSPDVARYLADLSGGNARRLVRLCFYAFQAASAGGTDVTRAIVREVAREQFELVSMEELRSAVVRVLDRSGLTFEMEKSFGSGRARVVSDFWVPASDSGCAIMLAQSVLQAADSDRLRKAGLLVRQPKTGAPRSILLVVNGYLSEELAPALIDAFDRVLVHNLRSFEDDLAAAVQGLVGRLERQPTDVSSTAITEKLEQLARQNHRINASLDEVVHRLPSTYAMREAVEEGLVSVFLRLTGSSALSTPFLSVPSGWRSVDSVFERAFAFLERGSSIAQLFRNVSWKVTNRDPHLARRDEPFGYDELERAVAFTPDVTGRLMVQEAISAFRDGVTQVLRSMNPERTDVTEAQAAVYPLCLTYDKLALAGDFVDWVHSVLRWSEEAELSPPVSRDQAASAEDSEIGELILELGPRVYAAVGDDAHGPVGSRGSK